jgi:hypothetical protein
MKADELGALFVPNISRLGALGRAAAQPSLIKNLLLETAYKFKKSYGDTPEPQTALGAPSRSAMTLS